MKTQDINDHKTEFSGVVGCDVRIYVIRLRDMDDSLLLSFWESCDCDTGFK